MPLPPSPIPRQRLHQRSVVYEGFRRDDGLFDIDAHLVDAKDHDFELMTGVRPAREAVHDMWARVTIDREFVIRAIEVRTDAMPYPDACDSVEPSYSRLIGASLVQGFRKRLHDDMGGVRGCTHVTELLGSLPTAAVQTFAGLRRDGEVVATTPDIICTMDSESGEAVGTEMLRYGQRISVLALPAPELFLTPKGLATVGPRAFGYDFDYKPTSP